LSYLHSRRRRGDADVGLQSAYGSTATTTRVDTEVLA